MSATTLFRGSIAAALPAFTLPLIGLVGSAQAQTPPQRPMPAGAFTPTTASGGSTTLVKDTFAAGPTRTDDKDGTAATVQAGGLFSTGNARSLAVTASGTYRYRSGDHQFSAGAAVNYGRAAKQDAPIETTVSNLQGLLRYDYFFAEKWALFVQGAGRRDKFQGLDLRANIDPGVAYYIMDDKKHRLWLEGGYDLQHDIRRQANVDAAKADPTAPSDAQKRVVDRHSARLFFGYDNQLNAYITFTTGLEYLQPFDPTEAWRITWNNALKSAISDKFSAATTFTLRYDHSPLPNVKDTDAITSVALIYNFR